MITSAGLSRDAIEQPYTLFRPSGFVPSVYPLDADWLPMQAGDVLWMAPYGPPWLAAVGDRPTSYIYYKDVNCRPL